MGLSPSAWRPYLAAGMVVEGVPVVLLDTAGVRNARNVVERLGVQRSRAAARAADIVLVVYDATVRARYSLFH